MNIVAIIPARGGSQRIPCKNLHPFAGIPLIAHTIGHALRSGLVTRVIVSTDDGEIAEVSLSFGAEIITRPPELSGATATSESALINVLDQLQEKEGYVPDLVVFLQCTSPLRADDDIDNAVKLFLEKQADSLFSACRLDKYFWKVVGDSVEPINYDYRKRWREQDFPPQFLENGSIFVCKPSLLRSEGNRLGGKIALYEMAYLNSFQIDSPDDILLCECLLNRR